MKNEKIIVKIRNDGTYSRYRIADGKTEMGERTGIMKETRNDRKIKNDKKKKKKEKKYRNDRNT